MSWTWTYLNAAGDTLDRTSTDFPTQADAESWIGESWHDLVEDGVDAVNLSEDGRHVYGPMSLRPVT